MNVTEDNPAVTIITPTRDRPESFSLSERWLAAQDFPEPTQLIVVDDGNQPVVPTLGQRYVRRSPSVERMTLHDNLLVALPHIKADRLLIVEDDDYYDAGYVSTMMDWLDCADLVGPRLRRIFVWPQRWWWELFESFDAPLHHTGMTRAVFSTLELACRNKADLVDRQLWRNWAGSKLLPIEPLVVGMKGRPGRSCDTGTSNEYIKRMRRHYSTASGPDADLVRLGEWIGSDVEYYR